MRLLQIPLCLLAVLVVHSLELNTSLAAQPSPLMGFNLLWQLPFHQQASSYDDLYYIQTQNRSKNVIIHCNAAYCYKQRSNEVWV